MLMTAIATAAAESVAFQDSAFEDAECSGAGPGHAAKESAAVDAVMIVIVENFVVLRGRHFRASKRVASG